MARTGRKKPSPIVTDRDGKDLYVRLDASGIHPLVAVCDGLALTYFGDKATPTTPYITVERAIAWHEKEIEDSAGHGGNRELAEAMKVGLAKFRAGRVEYT